jgi:hypothetical protein
MKYTQLAILINTTIINIAGFYFLDEECKPMTLLSCDLYDGHKYINDIFKVIS